MKVGRKYWAAISVIVLAAVVLLCGILSKQLKVYNGYCVKDARYPTDNEKIDAAINRVIKSGPPVVEVSEVGADGKFSLNLVIASETRQYSSVGEFLKNNANCCDLVNRGSEGYQPDVLDQLTGRISSLVSVRRVASYFKNGELIDKKITEYVALDSCAIPRWTN